MADYMYMLESRLTPEQQRGVNLVTEVARAHGMNVYLVGGVVRDILSGATLRDLDFAVQGNALKLQKDLEKAGAVVQGQEEPTRTLYLLLPGNLRGEVSGTRAEVYDKPGRPPEMTPGTIHEDLRRRDFSVNAMALSLNPGSRGLLLDPFNGAADIEAKHIRILHNYSFLEEPSRMLRALRFMARLDWTMEERTQARFVAAKENDYISHINKRLLGHELEQIAHEPDPLKVMRALEKEEWLRILHPHWSVAKVDVSGLNHLIKAREMMQNAGYMVDWGPASMYFLTDKLNSTDIGQMQGWIHRKSFVHDWKDLEDDAKALSKRLTGKEAATNSQTWTLLTNTRPETILFTLATSKTAPVTRKLNDFLTKWREIKFRFPLPEMAPLRITPELPEYPKLVEAMFMLMLDNKLKSTEEITKYLQPYSPPEPEPPPAPPRKARAKKATKKSAGRLAKAAAGAGPAGAAPDQPAAAQPDHGKRGKKGEQMADLKSVAETIGSTIGKAVAAVKSVAPAGNKKAAKPAKKSAAKKAPAKKSAAKKSSGGSRKKGPSKQSAVKKKK
jgi:tRNA nucleotidyltransferase (CCA-adding enzyme)